MKTYNVLIVDDHQMLAEMLMENFESFDGFNCVGYVNNGQELIDRLKIDSKIDFVVLDFSMPIIDGLTALSMLKDLNHKAQVLVVSSITSPFKIQKALSLGAMGFVNKSEKKNLIFEALQSIANEEIYISKLGKEAIAKLTNSETGLEYLTLREQEITELILEGLNAESIGIKLHLSQRTIEKHKENIFSKMEVSNKTELYKKIKDLGWD